MSCHQVVAWYEAYRQLTGNENLLALQVSCAPHGQEGYMHDVHEMLTEMAKDKQTDGR